MSFLDDCAKIGEEIGYSFDFFALYAKRSVLYDNSDVEINIEQCVFKAKVLEPEPAFDYFTLNVSPCVDDLILKNYSSIFGETTLYIQDFQRLRGNIKLQYFSKLKIFTTSDLYLDDVTFINVANVEISHGYEEKWQGFAVNFFWQDLAF